MRPALILAGVLAYAIGCSRSVDKETPRGPRDDASAIEAVIAFKRLIRDKTPVDACSLVRLNKGDSAILKRISPSLQSSVVSTARGDCQQPDTTLSGSPRLMIKKISIGSSGADVWGVYKEGEYTHSERYYLAPGVSRPFVVERIEWGGFVTSLQILPPPPPPQSVP